MILERFRPNFKLIGSQNKKMRILFYLTRKDKKCLKIEVEMIFLEIGGTKYESEFPRTKRSQNERREIKFRFRQFL